MAPFLATEVVAQHSKRVTVKPPLPTQVVLGSVKVASTPATFPMRFLLLRFLTHVASAPRVGTYIPLAPYLLEVFDAAALKGGKGKKRGSDIKSGRC